MSLNDFKGSSGGTYISAKALKDGGKGRITGKPYADENSGLTNKDGSVKRVLRVPMEVEGVEGDIWTPGTFAIQALSESLGPEYETWVYPVEGTFKNEVRETKGWKGFAWIFHPNPNSSAAEQSRGKAKNGEAGTTGKTGSFNCGIDGKTFTDAASLKRHMIQVH